MEESKKLLMSGKTFEALERLKKILPEFEGTSDEWKIHELIGAAFHDLGDAEGAAQAYFNAAKTAKYLVTQRSHYSNYLFALHYLNDLDREVLAQEHFFYNNLFRDVKKFSDYPMPKNKISIGYISPYFVDSSAARFYESLLTDYDHENFIVKCFSLSNEQDHFTEKIKSNVDKFITLENISIEDAAQKIFNEGVDILFDLGGHTDAGMTLQIMSYKPAKIQISGIGYFDTTGLKMIDYFLTDSYLSPIGAEKFFSEKLLRLSSNFAFTPSTAMKNNYPLPITNYPLTFACFNNFMKINDRYLKLVKKILHQVDNSKIIFQDTTAIKARQIELQRRIKSLKLPIDRVEIRCGNDNYLNDYSEADIILDTFPYNGGTMTATALYMNIPVISLYGNNHYSRFGADILRLADLTELIADSEKNFVEIAVDLARDKDRLIELKKSLRDRLQRSKLLDTKNFVSEMEFNYKRMVNK